MDVNSRESNVISSSTPEIEFVPLKLPRDQSDPKFVQSFKLAQKAEILAFWEKYGFVVVSDVLTQGECKATVDTVLDTLEGNSGGQFKRNVPESWYNWPSDGMERYGQVQRSPVFQKQFLLNRQNENIFKAFSLLFGTEEDLLVSHDRVCLYRPTKNVEFSDGSHRDIKKWKVPFNIHLDINPAQFQNDDTTIVQNRWNGLRYVGRENHFITENNIGHKSALSCQGVLNLLQNHEEDGGFMLVPGFTHYFDKWFEATKSSLSSMMNVPSVQFNPKNHWLNQHAVRVPMRAGSLVIFDSRTPHGAGPNNSNRNRCAQFIKMFKLTDLNRTPLLNSGRTSVILKHIQEIEFTPLLTPLGMKIFGLEVPETEPAMEVEPTSEEDKPTSGAPATRAPKSNQKGNNKSRIQGRGW